MRKMHGAAFTLIILGAAAAPRPYFVPPPDLTKNWLVHGADHRGARADWNPICRRYEARTPPLAAAAARLRSQDQSIKRGPAPELKEERVAGNATRTEDIVALVRTTWPRYCHHVVPAYRTWAALLPDAYAVAQAPNRSHAWIDELPREMLDYLRDMRPGEQKRGPKGVRVPLYYGWKLMRYGRRGTLSRPVVVASQCRHVSHKNPCCAADAQLRFARDLLSRGSKAKWFLLVDDDVFVHTYALARALATLDPAKALALVAPATRGRAGGCAGLAAAALSRAALEAVEPAATGRGIDAACTALGSPQRALAAVLASHGVDLLVPPARDVFVVGAAPDDYGELRDERREAADLACATMTLSEPTAEAELRCCAAGGLGASCCETLRTCAVRKSGWYVADGLGVERSCPIVARGGQGGGGANQGELCLALRLAVVPMRSPLCETVWPGGVDFVGTSLHTVTR